MKKIIASSLAALAFSGPLFGAAWNYQDGDVLLIFRESGFNTVEFDLGNINQFLNQPVGSPSTVTGWDLSLVTNTFGVDLTGVSVVLLATTSPTNAHPTAWLSGVEPNTTAYNVSPSKWRAQLYSLINAVGTRPVIYQAPSAGAAAYSLSPTYVAAYDNIVSAGGQNSVALPVLGGNSPFRVEQLIPGSFVLWGVQPSTASPKPADTLVGTFSIDTNGLLTFVAGPPPPSILNIFRADQATAVTFKTLIGGNYGLVATNVLGAAISAWPEVTAAISGDGGVHTLTHTNEEANGFYGVVRSP